MLAKKKNPFDDDSECSDDDFPPQRSNVSWFIYGYHLLFSVIG